MAATTDFVRRCWLDECDRELLPHQKKYCGPLHCDRDRQRRQRARELELAEPRTRVQSLFDDNAEKRGRLALRKAKRPILRKGVDADRIFDRVQPGEGRFYGEQRAIAGFDDPSPRGFRAGVSYESEGQTVIRLRLIDDAADEYRELTG